MHPNTRIESRKRTVYPAVCIENRRDIDTMCSRCSRLARFAQICVHFCHKHTPLAEHSAGNGVIMSAIGSAWSSALERVTGTAVVTAQPGSDSAGGASGAVTTPRLPEPFKELQPTVARMTLFSTYTGVAPGVDTHNAPRSSSSQLQQQQLEGQDTAKGRAAHSATTGSRAVFLSTPMLYVYTLISVFLLSFILLLAIRPRFVYAVVASDPATEDGKREALSASKAAAYAAGAAGLAGIVMAIMAIVAATKRQGNASEKRGSSKSSSSRRGYASHGGTRRSRRH
jgi:hypothetical protein